MWKDIKGYEGIYQVSDDGRVRRIYDTVPPKILKGKDGLYPNVTLSVGCHKKSFNIHRLVAETFLEIPEGKNMEVNHKDGNKWNNDVSNLEWVTQNENITHSREVLKRGFGVTGTRGKKPRPVRCLDKETGELIKEYPSVSHAARSFPNNSANARVHITDCCSGKQMTAMGYRWEYINN